MALKAIIFDYGGVLCFHPPEEQIRNLATACRLQMDHFLKAYWSLRPDYDRGDLTATEYWKAIGNSAGIDYSADEILQFRHGDIQFWIHLDSRMMEWARQVRSAGLLTGLLSNLPQDLGDHLRNEMHIPEDFDHHTFSYELRAAKPEAAIYQHAVEGLGVDPSEALFLDDRRDNVEGAIAFGMHAIEFESPERLKAQLAELNGVTGRLMPIGAPPIILK